MYNVKGRIYQVPTKEDGALDVGAVIMVFDRDVDELMIKSQMNTKDGKLVNVFTSDPQVAAGVRTAFERGDLIDVPVHMDAEAALDLVPQDLLKARAGDVLTIEELQALLASKQAALEPVEDESEDEDVEDDKDKPDDKPAETGKTKPVPPPVRKNPDSKKEGS